MFVIKRAVALLVIMSMLLSLSACDKKEDYISQTGIYFDTVVKITLYSTQNEAVLHNCMKLCRNYEKIFSTTDPESELYLLNLAAMTEITGPQGIRKEISRELFEVIRCALYFCDVTDGLYDITVRPVSRLWDFSSGEPCVPEKEEIEAALKKVDYRNVSTELVQEYDEKGNLKNRYFVNLKKQGTQLELGSIAKGYIAMQIKQYLEDHEMTSGIVSLGGNILCIGNRSTVEITDTNESKKEKDVPFSIGIMSPEPGESTVYEKVAGNNNSIVTSGIYQRCFEQDGKLYHHILDAHTGYPMDNGLASVTVISYEGMYADALSTVCFLAGYEKSLDILSEFVNTYAEFVYLDGHVERSPGFEDFILDDEL